MLMMSNALLFRHNIYTCGFDQPNALVTRMEQLRKAGTKESCWRPVISEEFLQLSSAELESEEDSFKG